MEWLLELVKHVSISRTFTGAVFVTAITTLAGSRIFPNLIEAPPKEWVPIATGVAIFSGALLFFWLVAGGWNLCLSGFRALSRRRAKNFRLSAQEYAFLEMLSECEDETLDLSRINYQRAKLSKLELLELVDKLAKYELLYRNDFGENLIAMTAEGRRTVLSVQRRFARDKNSQPSQDEVGNA